MGPLANQTASLYMPSVLRFCLFFLSDLTIEGLLSLIWFIVNGYNVIINYLFTISYLYIDSI